MTRPSFTSRQLDGPTVVLGLHGRFWHERTTVLARVSQFLTDRIPEIIDVGVVDPDMLLEENNDFEEGDREWASAALYWWRFDVPSRSRLLTHRATPRSHRTALAGVGSDSMSGW